MMHIFKHVPSTSLRCEMGHVEPLERPMTREGKVTV